MRTAAAALPVLVLAACGQPVDVTPYAAAWPGYRQSHISPDGRVVDNGQGGISHSEGQAYAMLLSEAAGDRATFDRVWRWTRTHLKVRPDGLLAWRWDPAAGAVTDVNNATDGDLVAAWALLRAAARWDSPAYRLDAWRLLNAIIAGLVIDTPSGPVLLPGKEGFVHDGVVTVNLSYWIFPALTHLGRLEPAGPWQALHASGRRLLAAARFGPWELPGDWIRLIDPPTPAPGFPARFGFEAIRVPLYACWDGMGDDPALRGLAAFWSANPTPPAWVALETGDVAPFALGPGAMAVRDLLLSGNGSAAEPPPVDAAGSDYYDATLALLAEVARHEARR